VGGDPGGRPNERIPDLLQTGLCLIGKSVVVEPEAIVGRNVCLGGFSRVEGGRRIEDGAYVEGVLPPTLRLQAGALRA
jgi:NDP-sugar pyrophosphorylase family protein